MAPTADILSYLRERVSIGVNIDALQCSIFDYTGTHFAITFSFSSLSSKIFINMNGQNKNLLLEQVIVLLDTLSNLHSADTLTVLLLD